MNGLILIIGLLAVSVTMPITRKIKKNKAKTEVTQDKTIKHDR